MTTALRSRPVIELSLVFTLALGLRLGYAALRWSDDFSAFDSGDYALYRIGGEHILAEGDFTNSLFLLRPPLFALLVALLDVRDGAILLANAAIGAAFAPLTVVLARQMGLSAGLALLAGLIVALDPGSAVYSSFLGPEPLANVTLLVMLIALLSGIRQRSPTRQLVAGALAGIALVLSVLTRPAPFLIWTGLSVWLLLMGRRHWRVVLVYVLVSATGIGAWIAHNQIVFDNPTVSTVSAYSLLYYRAASVEHWATGHDMDTVYTDLARRVEARMGRDTSQVDASTRHTHYTGPTALTNAMNAVAFETFANHPLEYLYTLPIGVARMFGFTNALPRWTLPIEIVWNVALLLGAVVGLWIAYRQRHWLLFWGVALITAYFTVGTLFVQTSGLDTRMRTMFTPHLAVACALAVGKLLTRRTWLRAEIKRESAPHFDAKMLQ